MIVFAWGGEHHMQKVFGVSQIVAGIDKGLALSMFVAHRGQGRHFRDQPVRGNHSMLRIVNVQRVVIKRRQRANNAAHDCHWVGIGPKAFEETAQLLVDHGVMLDGIDEVVFVFGIRQLTI